jgi:tight adherence protein B
VTAVAVAALSALATLLLLGPRRGSRGTLSRPRDGQSGARDGAATPLGRQGGFVERHRGGRRRQGRHGWHAWHGWHGRHGRHGRTVDQVEAEALDLLDGLAPALRAGLPPVAALRLVTADAGSGSGRSQPVPSGAHPPAGGGLPGLGEAAARGEPLGPVWSAHAEAVRSDDLRLVAAAWTMCDTLGSPLASTVAIVADTVRRRRTVRQRLAAALAGPRATMRVLTALPLSGPVVALAVGVSPGELYTEPTGAFSLGAGLTLLVCGRLWAARMIRAVTLEPRRLP